MTSASNRLSLLARVVAITVLVVTCTSAFADGGLERARKRGKLIAGIHYAVPEYKGGMKFRTSEAPDTTLLEDVARRLQLPLSTVKVEPGGQTSLLSTGRVDLALAMVSDAKLTNNDMVNIPTGYSSGPMAIMRTDTDIKTWEHLKGRKVCVSEGGLHIGTIAARYGAVELVYRAPADALIAVRVGECDAAVHDSALLEELIKYPEWKKFSARLPVGERKELTFVLPAADHKTALLLKSVVDDWKSKRHIDALVRNAVRNIAFEVYLDQSVPDCH